jgi:hypothetical protein
MKTSLHVGAPERSKVLSIRNIKNREKPNDVIHTPVSVAHIMIDMCELKTDDLVLDPSAGSNKVFYNAFPDYVRKDYCEITESKDFFEYHNRVDCVIGNPPYSLWDKWLEHTMSISDKFCYIFGSLNFTPARLTKIMNRGYGVTRMHMLNIDWWFGSSIIALFEKEKRSIITTSPNVYCEVCGKGCNRGKKGRSMNDCSPKSK